MKKIYKVLIILMVILLAFLVATYFYIRNDLYSFTTADSKKIVFEIKKGQGVKEIVSAMVKERLVRSDWTAYLYLKMSGYDKKLKAGTYLLDLHNSSVKNFEVIVSGETALKKLTILEGWTKDQIAEYLDSEDIVSKSDYLDAIDDKEWNYSFLTGVSGLEGFLYPDTYYVKYNATSDDIIKAQLDVFDKKLTKTMSDDIKKQGRSLKDVITLASIVEKEVTKDKDRKVVAGIFLSRIKEGMPLQSDATVNYATGKSKASPSLEDTKTSSLYNTYLHKGLPPAPISNPSILAIEAAIYPEYTAYRYYLNRQDTLETIFSVTYEEHLANKQRYLK